MASHEQLTVSVPSEVVGPKIKIQEIKKAKATPEDNAATIHITEMLASDKKLLDSILGPKDTPKQP